MTIRNWSENILFSSAPIHEPQTVEQLQEIVRASRKVRTLGARHSFNDAAAIDEQVDVDGTQEVIRDASAAYISLEQLDAPLEIDSERGTVTCSGGITYGELCVRMNAEGAAPAQYGFAPAHYGCGRMLDGYARFGRRERQPGDGGGRTGDCDGRR